MNRFGWIRNGCECQIVVTCRKKPITFWIKYHTPKRRLIMNVEWALGEPPVVFETNNIDNNKLKKPSWTVNTSNEGFLIWTLRPSDKYLTWNKSKTAYQYFQHVLGNVDNNESFRDFWLVFLLTNVDELYPRIY